MHHLGESGSSGGDVGRDTLSGDVGLLFVLRFCARPLAGPPVGRTDSAIAPDLQASTEAFFGNLRRETATAHRADASPSLAASFASPFESTPSGVPLRTTSASNRSAPDPMRLSAWWLSTLALPPHPCPSASSGRSWVCPSSSTSRAELFRSP